MKKSHLIILIVLLVLIAVYFIARSRQPNEKEVRFFSADSSSIGKLEFTSGADTIIVSLVEGEWKLTYPVQWDVNEDQINSFFSKVLPIGTSATPMSEDTNLQEMYKVDDSSAVQVKIYDKSGKLLDHVYIGNGTNTSYDYGRREGDKAIYQFKTNITNFVRPDVYLWRSTNITNLKRADIDHIDVKYTKNSYTLTILGDSIRYTDKRESFMIPQFNRAQHKVINALENLRTWQYFDKDTDKYAEAFKNPECTVTVYLKNKKTKTFKLIRKITPLPNPQPNAPDKDVFVLMMIDDKMTPLYQMTGDFINRFTRSAQHFKVEFD
jgi:hypothetical protein